MENNLNNKTGQSQNNGSTTAKTGNTSSSNASSASGNTSTSSTSGSTNSNQSTQGRSNQQATTGKGGMKNIQDMLQQHSGPIAKKINGLSTTQKIVGGSLLALGAGWIAMSSANKDKIKNKAGEFTSSAKQKMGSKKSGNATGSSTTGGSSSSRTGSSSVDARVK